VSASGFGNRGEPELRWIQNDYQGALVQARAENKPVFVDFTGYTCTNCRWMEANVFPKTEVQKEFSRYVLARLYTDGEGDVYERQQQLEQDLLGTVALPYYAIVRPDGTLAASFPGLTRNTSEFVDFLRNGAQN
jgi:thiol:disulfide interchange protein